MRIAARAVITKMRICQREMENDNSSSAEGFWSVFWKAKNAATNNTIPSKPKVIKMIVCSTFMLSPVKNEKSAVNPINSPMPDSKSPLRKNNTEPSSEGRWVWDGFNYFSSIVILINLSPGGVSVPGCPSRGVNCPNTSIPLSTCPKIVYCPSYCAAGA